MAKGADSAIIVLGVGMDGTELQRVASSSKRGLLERERELALITGSIAAARKGGGRALWVEGTAGIGKSSLLSAAKADGVTEGARWLGATGSELEREFPFGVVLQLFDRLVAVADRDSHRRLFAGPARLAIPVFGLTGGPERDGTRGVEDAAARHGLYWLASNIAEREPLVLAVDDVQWADLPSLRWLVYLARRIGDHRLLLILAARTGEPGTAAGELAALAAGATEVMRPAPLSRAAVGEIVGTRLGAQSGAVAKACHELAGGNPFYVSELVRAVAEGELSASAIAEHGQGTPSRVGAAVLARLERLPEDARALASALAVLGHSAQVQHLAALAGIEVERAVTAAEALTRAELVRGNETLAFTHQIVRSAVYEGLPGVQRARMHGLAATLLMAQAAPVGVVALHLLNAHPAGDAAVSDLLLRAAADARDRGASESAAAMLRRALAEPPPADRSVEVLLALADVEAELHAPTAIEHYEQATALLDARAAMLRCALPTARSLFTLGRVDEARERIASMLAALGPEDRELALEVQAEELAMETFAGALRPDSLGRLKALSDRSTGATPAERAVLAMLAVRMTMVCEPAGEVSRVARLALGGGPRASADSSSHWRYQALNALTFADALEESDRHLQLAIADAVERGAAHAYAYACSFRSRTAYRLGRLADAAALAQSALDLPEIEGSVFEGMAAGSLVEAMIERGDLDAATAAFTRVADAASGSAAGAPAARGVLARLRLAQRRFDEAFEAFNAAGEAQSARGATNPAMLAWRSGAATAAAHLGDGTAARQLIGEELRLARAFGAPRAIGIALLAAGTIEGVISPGGASLGTLAEAVEVLASSEARLDYGKALTELGSALRRAGQRSAAREQLRLGLQVAVECGALALAARARDEIKASGGRQRREQLSGIDSLTPSEHRVAQLAARGLTNREIAQELFLSIKTVEMHVGRVFRKLDLNARVQIGDLFQTAV